MYYPQWYSWFSLKHSGHRLLVRSLQWALLLASSQRYFYSAKYFIKLLPTSTQKYCFYNSNTFLLLIILLPSSDAKVVGWWSPPSEDRCPTRSTSRGTAPHRTAVTSTGGSGGSRQHNFKMDLDPGPESINFKSYPNQDKVNSILMIIAINWSSQFCSITFFNAL